MAYFSPLNDIKNNKSQKTLINIDKLENYRGNKKGK